MSTSTFHHFPSLPRELQIAIFREAAHIDCSIIPEYLDRGHWFVFSYTSGLILMNQYLRLHYPTAKFDTLNNRLRGGFQAEDVTGLGLMRTNVLAREVVMVCWRENLVDVTPEQDLRRTVEIIWGNVRR